MIEDDSPGLPLDIPEPARAALTLAAGLWHDEAAAAAHVEAAVAAAPEALAARIGAYKFHFYRHRYDEAVEQARAVLALAARRLQLPPDWAEVRPNDAGFGRIEPWPRLYLQALVGLGYCLARQGLTADGRAVLAKAAELDVSGKFGAARLVAVIDRGGLDDEDDG
ncbi:hypothetical protein [Magnetospirillum sp. UT-4]|uniref:hypothetical protein n=1 Tax=Magnetospirillum sp. UT-4 TaxID=2681467 RepID=UPI00137EC069|nr:hypothetical protein [Magnetospirillum sp. UT-4]CAA7611592.1 conserved hypothetical protein [Magnetospirillum sp. UT-4]